MKFPHCGEETGEQRVNYGNHFLDAQDGSNQDFLQKGGATLKANHEIIIRGASLNKNMVKTGLQN